MAETLNFTKARLTALPASSKRSYYLDSREPRLGLYVTPAGTKTYFARLRVSGKTTRYPIGRFPDMSIPLARQKAAEAAADTSRGLNLVAEKRRRRALSLTLSEALEDYIASRDLKPVTVKDYRVAITENFGDWLERPLNRITETMLATRYLKRGEVSRARADNGARVLSAVYNFARASYKGPDGQRLFPENPVIVLRERKIRFKPTRRRRKVKDHELAAWWAAVESLDNPIVRDLLVFLLLCGTRLTETATLRWEHLDFRAKTFTLVDPKNRNSVELPLPDHVVNRVKKRKKHSGWVFPGPREHLLYPAKSIRRVAKDSGVVFSPHDLRRTFVSVANDLDISTYRVKMLLNHKLNAADVTEGYDVPGMDSLRAASAKITGRILRLAGAETARVVRIKSA